MILILKSEVESPKCSHEELLRDCWWKVENYRNSSLHHCFHDIVTARKASSRLVLSSNQRASKVHYFTYQLDYTVHPAASIPCIIKFPPGETFSGWCMMACLRSSTLWSVSFLSLDESCGCDQNVMHIIYQYQAFILSFFLRNMGPKDQLSYPYGYGYYDWSVTDKLSGWFILLLVPRRLLFYYFTIRVRYQSKLKWTMWMCPTLVMCLPSMSWRSSFAVE